MVLFAAGKWPGLILASYLVLAIAGSFTFAVAEDLAFDEPGETWQPSSGCFTPINHPIDWLAEETAAISKGQTYSFSPLRYGGLRIFLPTRPHSAGKSLEQSSLNPLNKTTFFTIKNTILLKLRI
jgi:hypothetical protein